MRKVIVTGLILALFLLPAGTALGKDISKNHVLTMGKVTRKVSKQQKRMKPIIACLASRLSDVGIERGELLLAKDNDTFIEYLQEGKVDIVLETPFSASLYKLKTKAVPILIACRQGVLEYKSVIFVRRDSGIHSLEGLKGKIIAFEDPGSTSAYFLPRLAIESEGLTLVEMPSFDSTVPEDKIGYVFAGEELNVSTWVFFGRVDAGALSDMDWDDQEDNPAPYRKEFQIIYETMYIPRMLVLVREGIDERLRDRITEELLNMDKNEEGREALKPYKIGKFLKLSEDMENTFKPIEDFIIRTSAERSK
jgi:phosphonate transport system substrate-binding protein